MAVFITKCPHCNAEEMSFPIFGYRGPKERSWKTRPSIVAGVCGRCDLPVAATLLFTHPINNTSETFYHKLQQLNKADTQLDVLQFELGDTWPKSQLPEAPDNLPSVVDRAFIQAEKNRMMPDCEEAAATMYRRSLDLALKIAFPDESGMLDKKLKKLVEKKILPEAIGTWAHEVRLIGNDGAHDLEGVSPGDLLDARAFIDTVLKYLFTLPAQIEARQAVNLSDA